MSKTFIFYSEFHASSSVLQSNRQKTARKKEYMVFTVILKKIVIDSLLVRMYSNG